MVPSRSPNLSHPRERRNPTQGWRDYFSLPSWRQLDAVPAFGAAFLLGVAVRSWVALDQFAAYLGFLASLTLAVFLWRTAAIRWVPVVLAAACLGVVRYGLTLPAVGPGFVGWYHGRTLTVAGTVIAEPDVRLASTKLTLGRLQRLDGSRLDGKLLVSTRLYPEYQYGDYLRVTCKVEKPEPFNDFAYDRYLARQDIYATCAFPMLQRIGQGQAQPLFALIFQIKGWFQQAINRALPEPQASLLSSMVLGSRRGLPPELVEAFQVTGLTHLIAISGLQIMLVITWLGAAMPYAGIPRRVGFLLITIGLAAYLVLIGAPASAVRAGVMGWLALAASQSGRVTESWRVLLYAAVAMVAVNPKILRDDVGFQLSFAAVSGLLYLQPLLEQVFARVPEARGLRAALAMTLAAHVFTLPLIAVQFGRISFISPVANVLVFPVSSAVMLPGIAGSGLAGALPLSWAWLPMLPTYVPLAYLTTVAEYLARWPLAQLQLQLTGWLLVPSYFGLAWGTRWLKRWVEEREQYVIGGASLRNDA